MYVGAGRGVYVGAGGAATSGEAIAVGANRVSSVETVAGTSGVGACATRVSSAYTVAGTSAASGDFSATHPTVASSNANPIVTARIFAPIPIVAYPLLPKCKTAPFLAGCDRAHDKVDHPADAFLGLPPAGRSRGF